MRGAGACPRATRWVADAGRRSARAVVLGDDRGRAGDDRRRRRPGRRRTPPCPPDRRARPKPVGVGGAAVGRGDHVGQHPRPVGWGGSALGGDHGDGIEVVLVARMGSATRSACRPHGSQAGAVRWTKVAGWEFQGPFHLQFTGSSSSRPQPVHPRLPLVQLCPGADERNGGCRFRVCGGLSDS